jgi:hypothetical protein
MADLPFDDKVSMLRDVSSMELSEEDCRKFLRAYNNDLNSAMNHYFDRDFSALTDQAWDNSAFNADRYGERDDSAVPTFHIDYAPGIANYPHSGAPSRPPSRTSHHSASGDAPLPSIETTIGQESGVIGGTSPYFGPATKEHYDTNQWALVPTTTTTELYPDPVPSERKREYGGPAILKPLPSGDYLPALLTILHSVPLFRNFFLAPQRTLNDYGVNAEWWKGASWPTAQTVEYGSQGVTHGGLDLIHECQRLMAFLDSTDRAYGSVDALLNLEEFSKGAESLSAPSDSEFLKFLMVWARAYEENIPSSTLNGVLRSQVNANGRIHESWYLDATAIHHNPAQQPTIYDVLDHHLFSPPADTAFVTEISNVLILKLNRSDRNTTSLDVKIPSTLYADRYLEKNASKVKEMLQEIKSYEDQIAEIDRKSEKYRSHTLKKDDRKVDSLQLLKVAMDAFRPLEGGTFRRPKDEITLSNLERAYGEVERKIKFFDEQKQELQDTLNNTANAFRAPMEDVTNSEMDTSDSKVHPSATKPQIDFTEAYRLRGVSTRPNIFYLLHPDINSNVQGEMQWWRVEFCSYQTSESYIIREKVSLETVLEKASTEHTEALLVYANDEAINMGLVALSKPLQDFVQKDNLAFLEEIQSETMGTTVIGDWDNVRNDEPPDYNQYPYNDDFQTISAAEFNRRVKKSSDGEPSSAFSSTTLTPNTEIGDDARDIEMSEVGASNAFFNSMPLPMAGINGGSMDDEVVDVVLSPEMETDTEEGKKEGDEKENRKTVRYVEDAMAKGG